jgi:hypothetical protein
LQVRDTPVLVEADSHPATLIVGAGGSGINYGPSPSSLTNSAAPGTSVTLAAPTWVVSQGGRDQAPADVVLVDRPPTAGVGASVVDTGMATIEELFGAAYERARTISTDGDTFPCFWAPFALRVTAFYVGITSGTVAASDTDYWTCTLQKFPTVAPGSPVSIATKTTRSNANGGEGMTLNKAWGFDASVFDVTNMVFAKGDMLRVLWNKTLAPASITAPLYTWRYEPI